MAVLNAADRQKVKDQLSRSFAWSGLTKPDIAAAVNAIDDFLEANATAINNAFPAPLKRRPRLHKRPSSWGMWLSGARGC